MNGSNFIFDCVDLSHCKFHKIILNCEGSNVDYPYWIKNKTATINPKDNDKCFQYVITVALNHEQIVKASQRVSKTKPFINKYNWKREC